MKIIMINAMWCPGCIVMHKVWNEIKNEYKDFSFESYDYDMDEEEVKKFNPGKILPITILFKEEKEVGRLNGEVTKEQIIELINQNK